MISAAVRPRVGSRREGCDVDIVTEAIGAFERWGWRFVGEAEHLRPCEVGPERLRRSSGVRRSLLLPGGV